MSLRITCPGCKASYPVDDELRGKKVRCKKCDEPVTVPAGRKDEEAVVESKGKSAARRSARDDDDRRPSRRDRDDDDRRSPRRDRDDDEPRRAKKGKSGALTVLMVVGGGLAALGVVAVALVLVVVFVFWKSADPAPKVDFAQNNDQKFPMGFQPPGGGQGPPGFEQPGGGQAGGANPNPPPPTDPIDAATRDKVKKATVYIEVTMAQGVASGSGFFAVEPGIVITNAHVLGMLQAKSKPPSKVDVIINSGQVGAKTLKGTVLGADRDSDLAVVRVADPDIPPPLPVHTAHSVAELHEVYYFGFPFGKKLGAEISINKATVASLRKDLTGTIKQVQLTGDMLPGNSGGPVVDGKGRVIGIAVSGYMGTRVNFAVAADSIKLMLDGRVEDSIYGDPYDDNNQIKMPVKLRCLDPLRRVKSMGVEVWAGNKDTARALTMEQPQPQPGDGPRQKITLDYKDGVAEANIPLPPVPAGQVYWVQPVVVNGAGVTQWQQAAPCEAAPPLQRIGADLQLKNQSGLRTLKIKDTRRMMLQQGKRQLSKALHCDADVLEAVTPTARGTHLGLNIGNNRFQDEEFFGKLTILDPNSSKRVQNFTAAFLVNGVGRALERADPKFDKLQLSKADRDNLELMYSSISDAFQMTLVVMPNRALNPLQTWPATVPMLVGSGPKKKQLDMGLTCTYLGTRKYNGRIEALASIDGTVRSHEKAEKDSVGTVRGRIVLDLDGGYLAQVRINSSTEFEADADTRIVASQNVELTRILGNPDNIKEVAKRPEAGEPNPNPDTKPNPPVVGTTKPLLDVKEKLAVGDLIGPSGRKMKNYPNLRFEAGKTYVIEMKAMGTSKLNPYLILLGPNGKAVAQDDDSGGGVNAKITFMAPQAGNYTVVATSGGITTQYGQFHLTVMAKE